MCNTFKKRIQSKNRAQVEGRVIHLQSDHKNSSRMRSRKCAQ